MAKVNAMYQDKIGAEYERGAINAYYGRRPNPNHSDVHLLEAYMEGYNEKPYGEKDHGYDD